MVQRFADSMHIDYEKWHDGIGYNVTLINEANAADKAAIESLLLSRGAQGWREVEALATLDTPHARTALLSAASSADTEIRMAVSRFAPQLIPTDKKVASLVAALETGEFYGGLTQAMQQVEHLHPPEVIDALFRGILQRSGDVACHFAAMLLFLHGKADEPFDWNHRPFFLRFNTENRAERQAAFQELVKRTG